MWQQHMRIGSETQVFYCAGMPTSLAAATSQEFLSVLQQRCVIFSCELSINIQQKQDGLLDVSLRTTLPTEKVVALIASVKQNCQDCIVNVVRVKRQIIVHTGNATSIPSN